MAAIASITTTLIARRAIQRESVNYLSLFVPRLEAIFTKPIISCLVLGAPLINYRLGVPSLSSIIESIWDGILRAVPKKKTSHSKKRMRASGKFLHDKPIRTCSGCGRAKLPHHLCPHCFVEMRKEWKARNRGNDPVFET